MRAQTKRKSQTPFGRRRCAACGKPLVAIGWQRKNGLTCSKWRVWSGHDWLGREFHKKCYALGF